MPFEGGTENTPREIERIPDAMVAASTDVTRGDGHVDLRFYHLLTCLNFKVSNHNETNAVVVRGLRLKGTFYRSIEIDMAGDEVRYPADSYSGTFVFLDGAQRGGRSAEPGGPAVRRRSSAALSHVVDRPLGPVGEAECISTIRLWEQSTPTSI